MSKQQHDINDDEIRIIPSKASNTSTSHPNRKLYVGLVVLTVIAAVIVIGLLFFFLKSGKGSENPDEFIEYSVTEPIIQELSTDTTSTTDATTVPNQFVSHFVAINDTTIRGKKFSIYRPTNATPRLHIGDDVLNDSTITFVVQAADVRRDNGKIVGAYVYEGELLSKGQAKSGYCAIIGGKINLGVAEATPLLEQALESNGYFFRQYPLVVANQVIENKPKNISQRKALAELNGNIVVIMSHDRLSFHDFAQALVDMGVSNAIYLVGSSAYGFAKDADGHKIEFGKQVENAHTNTNYIVWD